MNDPNARRSGGDQGGSLISDQMQSFTKWPEAQWEAMADQMRPILAKGATSDEERAEFEAMCFEVAS